MGNHGDNFLFPPNGASRGAKTNFSQLYLKELQLIIQKIDDELSVLLAI